MATKEPPTSIESEEKIHCAEDPISPELLRHVSHHIVVSERFHFALEQLKLYYVEYSNVEYYCHKEAERNLEVFFHLVKHDYSSDKKNPFLSNFNQSRIFWNL